MLLTAFAALMCGYPAVTTADASGDVFVLPVTLKGEHGDAVTQLTEEIESELERVGTSVMDRQKAAGQFDAEHGEAARAMAPDAVDQLANEADAAVLAFLQRKPAECLVHTDRVREMAEPYLDTLNVTERAHRGVLAACVAGVQAHAERQQSAQAGALATWCLTTLTGLDPDKDPLRGARTAFQSAQAELHANRTQPFMIRSTPSSCTLLVQGVAVGVTPYAIEHPARRTYAIQALCRDRTASRVHRVNPANRNAIDIDVAFDRVVRTEGTLAVRYDDGALTDQRIRSDTDRIAGILHASTALAVYAPSARQFTIRRIGARDGARIDLPASYTPEQLRAAVARAMRGDPQTVAQDDAAGESAPPSATPKPSKSAERADHARWSLWTGGALTVAGAAGFITGAVLLHKRVDDADALLRQAGGSLAEQQRWQDGRVGPRVASASGAVAMSAGFVLLGDAIDPERHPWLPITTAVLGVGALSTGAVLLAGHHQCEGYPNKPCIEREQRTDRGVQVVMAAMPLLAFSTAQFFRWLVPPARLQASVGPGRLTLGVSGSF